jgi:hypothetical protein
LKENHQQGNHVLTKLDGDQSDVEMEVELIEKSNHTQEPLSTPVKEVILIETPTEREIKALKRLERKLTIKGNKFHQN